MSRMVFSLCVVSAISIPLPALSQAIVVTSVDTKSKNITISEGQVAKLRPGSFSFTRLALGKNAKLILTGDTTIHTEKLALNREARIEFEKASAAESSLTLLADDASETTGISIIGNGAEGLDAPTARAPNGPPGEGGKCSLSTRRSGGPGGRGTDGQHGQNGTGAADVTLYLVGIPYGTPVEISAVGGNGGDGQDAGFGGRGGDGASCKSPGNGGAGGNGGNAGNGGPAGHVLVSLIPNERLPELTTDRASDWISVNFLVAGGSRGNPGRFGSGGGGGKAKASAIGSSSASGPDGSNGAVGQDGTGPRSTTEAIEVWAKVQFMDPKRYAQRLLATIAQIQGKTE